jgi:hypothetical protein
MTSRSLPLIDLCVDEKPEPKGLQDKKDQSLFSIEEASEKNI